MITLLDLENNWFVGWNKTAATWQCQIRCGRYQLEKINHNLQEEKKKHNFYCGAQGQEKDCSSWYSYTWYICLFYGSMFVVLYSQRFKSWCLKKCDDKREIMDKVQSKERQKSNKVKTELSRLLVVLHRGANPANIIATASLTDSPGGVWWWQRLRRCCVCVWLTCDLGRAKQINVPVGLRVASGNTMSPFSQRRSTSLVSWSVCFVNAVCVGACACVSVCGTGRGWVSVRACLCVCVVDGWLKSTRLPFLSLFPSSREHNPYMTLNSWLTAPPSRVFHPTQNNIVHLQPPPPPPDRQTHTRRHTRACTLPCAWRDTHQSLWVISCGFLDRISVNVWLKNC